MVSASRLLLLEAEYPMSSHRPTRKIVLAAALLLALAVVVTAGASVMRKVESFQSLGFSAAPRAGHWLVTAVESDALPLEQGDQLLLINGQSTADLSELRDALARRPTSELLVLRGEEMLTLSYHRPRLRFDVPYLVLALIGLAYLLIGFYTLWKDRRRPALLFYFWSLTSAVLYLVTPTPPFDGVGKTLFLSDQLARLFLAPLTLHLFLVFPRPLLVGRRSRLAAFLYLPAVVLLVIQTDLMLGGRLVGDPAKALRALDQLELVHLVAFALTALGVLIWRLASRTEWEQRRQLVWISVGLAGGYLPFLGLYMVPRSLDFDPPRLLVLAAIVPLALVPLSFAYAILRYRLWDIGIIVRDTISLTLTVLIGIFAFSLFQLLLDQMAVEISTLARNVLTVSAALLIAGLLVPARRGIQTSLSRLQYGRQYQRRRALAEFGRDLLRETDLGEVSESLLERLEETVELDRVNLLLTHGDRLRPMRAEATLPEEIPLEEAEDRLWKADVVSLSGVALPADEVPLEQRLFALDYRYSLPLMVRDKRVGLLVASYRTDGSPLSSDDLDLIRNLLAQTALAIENAKLFAQVQEQLDEVSRLQRFNQGIIESSPAGIVVYDGSGSILSANEAFARLTGRRPRDLVGADIRRVMRGLALPAPHEGILETHFHGEDGEERYLQLSTADLRQDSGGDHRLLVLQDVTERVAMENALKEKDRLAALGMLAAGVAHEVNTPLTGISSYAQMLLADTDESDPRYEILRKVERQTFRASRIVNNLLDFSRQREGDRRLLELAAVLREALDLLKERRLDNGVRLGTIDLDERVRVRGDEGELQQVFTNLIVNAIDAMADRGGTLSVSMESGTDRVAVTVADTGPGIPSDRLERIFQPFFSTKLGRGGTGLGLSISYNIVRRHGGDIRVVSRPGEGTWFTVELPRHPEQGSTERSEPA